jgi:hypothetical protein
LDLSWGLTGAIEQEALDRATGHAISYKTGLGGGDVGMQEQEKVKRAGRRMKIGLAVSGLVLVGALAAAQVLEVHPRRLTQLLINLAVSQPNVVIIGDSITNIATQPTTCGAGTFDAGIPGYTVKNYAHILPVLASLYRRGDIVIALGSNDSRDGAGSVQDFGNSYRSILDKFGSRVRAVVAIPPFGHSDFAPNPRRRLENNAVIDSLAAARKIPVAHLQEMETEDGLHPNAKGKMQWNAAVSQICRH